MTEKPDVPSTPPEPDGRPSARVSRRNLLGGAGLLGLGAAAGAAAATAVRGSDIAKHQQSPSLDVTGPASPATARQTNRPLNVILVIRDQTRFDIPAAAGYNTPALDRLAQQGITFRNHYIASAMCTPSRAALYSGHPPQVNGVFDQMETGWVPNLSKDQPNMGSMMKKLGYQTAFFGKWEMEADLIPPKPTVNYSEALQPYGFDIYQPDGDKPGAPNQGYDTDVYTAGEGVRWLRGNVPKLREAGQPFFLIMSYLNPHDIMYADANVPGTPQVQQGISKEAIVTPPKNSLYDHRWHTAASATLTESLSAPGMPAALAEYHTGWEGVLGTIPTNRPDMWEVFNDYYLNMIRDTDLSLQQLEDALDELSLWDETVVIFTADHGEMAGDHGGIRGKGPMAYEGNSHVPLIVVHPDYPQGQSSDVVTSHLDLMPSLPGLAKVPESQRVETIKGLPGHDFSDVLATAGTASPQAVRRGALFNYVGPLTIDADYCVAGMKELLQNKPAPPLTDLASKLNKRGFLSFAFDGQYKFARYYAPNNFNTPTTLEEILRDNDIQLFDLKVDPLETHNLALDPQKNGDLIMRMNALLNQLIATEVGTNDGSFLPESIRPHPR
ncbi:sulfatase-like hydrolase/transferase [Mycolicibacterium sphagni]|uniref:sulfatase-like hydrolase/transferase n=1 Tax=Mycolicibacterium sphagni TaxID=1786 RepID=UPI0021F37EBC|nr:sulfatase-like hydrolase/transferase [Mycolicibacterium sphagni]MCV7178921.1 sulfatase-like hydrolase/transferase [Mycolicibacterium sphagni]